MFSKVWICPLFPVHYVFKGMAHNTCSTLEMTRWMLRLAPILFLIYINITKGLLRQYKTTIQDSSSLASTFQNQQLLALKNKIYGVSLVQSDCVKQTVCETFTVHHLLATMLGFITLDKALIDMSLKHLIYLMWIKHLLRFLFRQYS